MATQKFDGLVTHAFRLKPGQDLKSGVLEFAKRERIMAGCLLSVVGCVRAAHLRFANQNKGALKKGFYEIVSMVGTFSTSAAHIHIALADSKGKVLGGHLLEGTLVYTTAEIVVADLRGLEFKRAKDQETGYHELIVTAPKTNRKKR